MEPVHSPRNRRVAEAVRLRRSRIRRETGLTLLEGPALLADAVAADAVLEVVFGLPADRESKHLAEDGDSEWIPVTQEVLHRLAPTQSPRGPVAVLRIPEPAQPERDLMLLDLNDPGNAGTLIRSAAAFGFDIGATAGAADLWSPKVLRAGAGAHFRTRVAQPLEETPADMLIVGSVVEGGVPLPELGPRLVHDRRWALLVGSEAHGLSERHAEAADVLVTVPMPGGIESLNAGVAGSIVAYQLALLRKSGLASPGEH